MKINFKFDENEIKSIEFDIKTNIESMLKTYLNETNSKQSLKNSDILFIYGDKILNSNPFIHMKIENIFNRQKKTITVKDKNKIIGGLQKKICKSKIN
jgi:hypothetical protein